MLLLPGKSSEGRLRKKFDVEKPQGLATWNAFKPEESNLIRGPESRPPTARNQLPFNFLRHPPSLDCSFWKE